LIGRAILDPRRAGWSEALTLGARMLPKTPVPGGRRRRRQLARQRRRERDRLVYVALGDGPTNPAARQLASTFGEPFLRSMALTVNVEGPGWARRALLGRPTAEDISELLRHGFPLLAGLRGEMLAAYKRSASARARAARAPLDVVGIAMQSARRGELVEIMMPAHVLATTPTQKGTR
jgi:hypothetical protein